MTPRNAMCFVVSSHSHSKRIGNGTSAGAIKQLLANPEDIPGLVAVRCDVDGSTDALGVELLNVNKLDISGGWKSGGTPGTTPASSTFIDISTAERPTDLSFDRVSWYSKGKKLAIGLQSGEIVTFAPAGPATPKSTVSAPAGESIFATASLTWLSNPAFLAVCIATDKRNDPDADRKHYLRMHDAKNPSDAVIGFSPPFYASLALRPSVAFCVLKNRGNSRFIIFIGDGTSSDIGVLGCIVEQQTSPGIVSSRGDHTVSAA